MIQVGYTNIQSKIKINGLLSDTFNLMGGVHWGCRLSMLLYFTEAKILTIFINTDARIKGVQTGDQEIKISNFPYDTTIFY